MALAVRAQPDALIFASAGFHLNLGIARLTLPRWLSPGAMTVTHRELGHGRFEFELRLAHPDRGEMIRQTAIFEESTS